MSDEKIEYKKYSQHMYGQFNVKSKKAQALFIGRSIQKLQESVETFRESKKLKMDTLRFVIEQEPLRNDENEPVKDWILLEVRYEIASLEPYTEEDRKRDAERLEEARKWKEDEEKQYGEAAVLAAEEEMTRGE